MKNKLKGHRLFAVAAALSLLSACSLSEPYTGVYDRTMSIPSDHVLLCPEYNIDNSKKELELARLSSFLDKEASDKESKAAALYTLSALYDSMGLEETAKTMLISSLMLRPDFGDAYNLLGFYLALDGRYLEAMDALDQAVELGASFAFINRGIALIYAGKESVSLLDLEHFYTLDKNDPYRLLWLYIAEKKVLGERVSADRLSSRLSLIEKRSEHFAFNAIELYLGTIDVKEYMQRAKKAVAQLPDIKVSEVLCDAYYYLARYCLEQGKLNEAYDYLKLVLSTRCYDFLEYRLARVDIENVRKALGFENRVYSSI